MPNGLLDASRFHYAIHAVFAGQEGWESPLPLAAGGRLTVPDVLALGSVPRTVVLSGCEAAKNLGDAESSSRAAILRLRSEDPTSDWAAFRALVP